jgi:hypothetical protein
MILCLSDVHYSISTDIILQQIIGSILQQTFQQEVLQQCK